MIFTTAKRTLGEGRFLMDIIYTPRHRQHVTEGLTVDGNPWVLEEVPARAEAIHAALLDANLGPVSTPEDHGLEPLLAVHTADFVAYLQTAYNRGVAETGKEAPLMPWTFAPRRVESPPRSILAQRGYYAFSTDVPIGAGTWEAAYWSAQCALTAANRVRTGSRAAYALCRPPGHHAHADLYGGFCYLNNAASAARALQTSSGERVAVLDIDFHHGNGTQDIFYTDPAVSYVSLHGDPAHFFPFYWGYAEERGAGAGEETNLNLPLPAGVGDVAYLRALDAALSFIRDFAPRYLVISAGFDTAACDPVGGFALSAAGFREIGMQIAALGLPTVIVQEGGYNLARLGQDAVAFLSAWA